MIGRDHCPGDDRTAERQKALCSMTFQLCRPAAIKLFPYERTPWRHILKTDGKNTLSPVDRRDTISSQDGPAKRFLFFCFGCVIF